MLTPLEVFFVLLLIFIVFAVSVVFISLLLGIIQPSVMTNSSLYVASPSSNGVSNFAKPYSGNTMANVYNKSAHQTGGINAVTPRHPSSINSSVTPAMKGVSDFLTSNLSTSLLGSPINDNKKATQSHSHHGKHTAVKKTQNATGSSAHLQQRQSNSHTSTISSTNSNNNKINPGGSTNTKKSIDTIHAAAAVSSSLHQVPSPSLLPTPITYNGTAHPQIEHPPQYYYQQQQPVINNGPQMHQQYIHTASVSPQPGPYIPPNTMNRPMTLSYQPSQYSAPITAAAAVTAPSPVPSSLTPIISAAPSSVVIKPSITSSPIKPTMVQTVSNTSLVPFEQCDLKLALVVDGDFTGELKGAPMRDVVNMTKCLVEKYNFSEQNIYILTPNAPTTLSEAISKTGVVAEKVSITQLTPDNIRTLLRVIVQRCREFAQKSLVYFYYSGHGTVLSPTTTSSSSHIVNSAGAVLPKTSTGIQVGPSIFLTNDEIYELLILRLPVRTRVFSFIDACCSGSAMSLPFVYDHNTREWYKSSNQYTPATGTNTVNSVVTMADGGPHCVATCIAASAPTQVSTQVNGSLVGHGGALTVAFLESGQALAAVDDPVQLVTILSDKLQRLQIPQLESSIPLLSKQTE